MKYPGIIIVLVISFISCDSSDKQSFEEYQLPEISLLQDQEFEISFELNNPFKILALDSVILLHDKFTSNDETYYLRMADSENARLLLNFGREGRGPDEFQFPIELSRIPGKDRQVAANNRRLFEVKILSIDLSKKELVEPINSIYGPFDVRYSRIVALDSLTFIGTGYFENERYAISDTTGGILNTIGEYPFPPENKSSNDSHSMAYQSRLAVHPNGGKIANATIHSPNFEVFTITDNRVGEMSSLNFHPVKYKDNSNAGQISIDYLDDNIYGYVSIDANASFIYALYSGRSFSERNHRLSNTIIRLDWDGVPRLRILLPFDVSQITVDPSNMFIFAIRYDDGGAPELVRFTIPDQFAK